MTLVFVPVKQNINPVQEKYQEIEGPPIALEILKDCSVSEDMIQRICFLIAYHHTYQSVDDIDYQILIEADFG